MTPAQVAHITPPLPEPDQKANDGVCCGHFTTGGSYMGQSEELCCGQPDERWPDYYTAEQMQAYARAAVEAALSDAPQAEGWVMVPVEPTKEMIDAYLKAGARFQSAKSDWAAMLAARPSAPTAVEPDERATCEWTLEDDDNGTWQSSCGELWSFIEGGPKENRVSFCHNCGKPAIVRASKGTPL